MKVTIEDLVRIHKNLNSKHLTSIQKRIDKTKKAVKETKRVVYSLSGRKKRQRDLSLPKHQDQYWSTWSVLREAYRIENHFNEETDSAEYKQHLIDVMRTLELLCDWRGERGYPINFQYDYRTPTTGKDYLPADFLVHLIDNHEFLATRDSNSPLLEEFYQRFTNLMEAQKDSDKWCGIYWNDEPIKEKVKYGINDQYEYERSYTPGSYGHFHESLRKIDEEIDRIKAEGEPVLSSLEPAEAEKEAAERESQIRQLERAKEFYESHKNNPQFQALFRAAMSELEQHDWVEQNDAPAYQQGSVMEEKQKAEEANNWSGAYWR